MFNFKIDPKTKLVETSTTFSDGTQSTSVPNMPLTQADVSGDLKYAPRTQFSDWLGDLPSKNKNDETTQTSTTSTEVEKGTEENKEEPKKEEQKKEKAKISYDDAKGVDISAENEKVVDDFHEGDID